MPSVVLHPNVWRDILSMQQFVQTTIRDYQFLQETIVQHDEHDKDTSILSQRHEKESIEESILCRWENITKIWEEMAAKKTSGQNMPKLSF